MFGKKSRKGRGKSIPNGKIQVSDPEIMRRLRFQALTEEDLGVLASWKEACEGISDHLADRFYEHIKSNPATQGILDKYTTMAKQRPMMTKYVMSFFSGKIDDEYVGHRHRVGVAHNRINLDFAWYVSMYEVIRQCVVEGVTNAGASTEEIIRFNDAMTRLIQTDIALVSGALAEAQHELQRQVESQRDSVMEFFDETSKILNNVAERDLTARMVGEYSEEFVEIKTALNTAINNLDDGFRQVASGAEQVNAAAGQISSGSQSLAEGASEQASSLQEVSSSLQEMSAMSGENAENAREAQGLADGTSASARKGVSSMERLSAAIEKIKDSADETSKIVKTIDEIAFQTNLLALNAAVEAARAGDAGKGFAVVAEEVRNLAIRSAEAAKNTANLIELSVTNSNEGVAINQEVLSNLVEISGQVEKVSSVMISIAESSAQQSLGVEQVNTSVEQMNRVTQQTAANAEESASAAEELSSQAREMESMAANFKLTNTGRSARPTQHVSAPKQAAPLPPVAQSSAAPKTPVKESASTIPFDDEGAELMSKF